MQRFKATLTPVPHGGNFVVVPPAVATATGLAYGVRVRGTVEGVEYRSSLMVYSGVYHLGVHKATIAAAGAKAGDEVAVTIEIDDKPLPTDTVPPDLQKALKASKRASAGWASLSPSHKREHVKHIIEAKKPETRTRRIETTIAVLEARTAEKRATPKRAAKTAPKRAANTAAKRAARTRR
jgi:hypothetical protein